MNLLGPIVLLDLLIGNIDLGINVQEGNVAETFTSNRIADLLIKISRLVIVQSITDYILGLSH